MSDHTAKGITALTGFFIGFSVVIVGLRFAARVRTKAPYLQDGWLMLTALLMFAGVSTCVFLLVSTKIIGYSCFQFTTAEKIARHDEGQALQTALVATTVACLASTKASALFFYKRIFGVRGTCRRVFDNLLVACIAIVACWFVAFTFLTIFQCQGHYHGLWDPKLYAKYCTVSWSFLYGFSVSDVLLDVIILALPVPSILKLHVTLSRKLSILAIFTFACVALGASIARLVIYYRIFVRGVEHFNKVDSEQILSQYVFYYVLECGVSIVAINLPSVWPLFSGHGLEGIMKMARSVTSLSSRTSTKSAMKDKTMEKTHSSIGDHFGMGADSDHTVTTREVSDSNGYTLPMFGILREDSVNV